MIARKKFATSTVVALTTSGFIAAGCGLFGDEDEDDGGNATGGVATGGALTGGSAGTGPTGGSITGGTSTGGTATGGAAGSAVGGAAGSGGAGGMMGFQCNMPDTANCGVISDFPAMDAQAFGNADFSGGVSVFGTGIMRDTTDTGALHVTGMVNNYGKGFNIWFTLCSSLQMYGGVEFKVSGTTTDAMAMNTIDFQAQTNSDYPWQPFVMTNGVKGTCTAPEGTDPWSICIAPGKSAIMLSDTPQQVMWADITGGMPTMWSATMSPNELVGLQWQFPWSSGRTAYTVDVTLDDVKFIGGTGPTTACPPYMMGGGGMGGMGGMAGMAGGGAGGAAAGAGGAGAGGAAAGAGGAGGASAGGGGRGGGRGGMGGG